MDNPKSEFRISKQIQNPNFKILNFSPLGNWYFDIRACFGFRTSNLGFPLLEDRSGSEEAGKGGAHDAVRGLGIVANLEKAWDGSLVGRS
jgi:hypothetical protein